MKQTAVEWLIEQVKDYDFAPASDDDEYVIVIPKWILSAKRDEAKAMEKEQIEDAYQADRTPCSEEDAEQYYNQTYGGDK
jgi:hypothetical protein